ncbi:ATPase [Leptotrichia wadei]|uniref:ATPase n=1 Tax=Leptotrichia wadei TaxID=157687 RepID=UPI0028DB921E|nr:ATPase [Leptotrichia wadei]
MELQKITEKFKNEANQDKVSASYLFYGDKRVDLLSYALMFSKMIMTKNIQNDAEKEKIERLIDISQHPDIEIINKNNENIKIDEVREIIYSSIESSFNSPKKIFILCGIENLRKESSNALLKILEEPPKNVYFILLSRTLNIIPTIKSRTIKFHLSGMNNEELGVSKEIYYFFDGNENDILEFKRQKLSLDDIQFQINTVEDILQIVTEMKNYVSEEFAVKNSLDLTIKYNKSIELIARRIRFWELKNLYFFINEIENELKKEREFLIGFLSKIIINAKNSVETENLKNLINLKNSIRNNVNIKSVLFNFFDILQNS